MRGLTVQKEGGDHTILVTGTGLGPASDRVVGRLDFKIGDRPVSPLRENRSANNTAEVSFGADQISGFFDPDDKKARLVPLVITLRAQRPKTWAIWRDVDETKIETKVWLAFFPDLAGEARVVSRHKTFGWVPEQQPLASPPRDSDDCGEGKCRVSYDVGPVKVAGGSPDAPKEGDRRIVGGTCTCQPLWGPNSCGGWHTKTFAIVDQGSTGVCKVEHWTERNRYQTVASVERYSQTGVSERTSDAVQVRFSQSVRIEIPPDLTTYEVEFRSITGQVERRQQGQAATLFSVREVDEGVKDLLVLTAARPPGSR